MQTLSPSLRIGVIRGGPSAEYDISLKTGANVLKHLSDYRPVDILISKDGKWHINGIERLPERIFKNVDVVWNALHGAYGEDGGVQDILSSHGVLYTGSDKFPSALAINKLITKDKALSIDIKTPVHVAVRQTDSLVDKAKEIFNSIPHPLVVKPINGGSLFGFYIVENFQDLVGALETVLENFSGAIVEEFIRGKTVSCLVTEDFRDQDIYSFPPQIVGYTPDRLSKVDSEEVSYVSKKIHQLLGLRHYSKSDFIVSPRRGVYLLEVNTSPKISSTSKVNHSLESVGVSPKEFIHHVISLALNRK